MERLARTGCLGGGLCQQGAGARACTHACGRHAADAKARCCPCSCGYAAGASGRAGPNPGACVGSARAQQRPIA